MNIRPLSIIACLLILVVSCKQKQTEQKEDFFPVLSFLKSQVADIDTSLYSIRKYVIIDSLDTDTIYVPREKFREIATDFLTIPDLSEPKYKDRYQEEKMFDETLNSVLLTYTPLDPDKEQVQRQEVLIKPDPSGDKITNIIINLSVDTKDSSVHKRMLWKVDQGFQVITTRQLAGQPETITTEKVIWGENE
ncbi:MAG TPA: hypothetical protein PLV32_00480 [Chitinophagaceae bacterium]|nr:hypothetical protein [Chitinophagaceae bacterium]